MILFGPSDWRRTAASIELKLRRIRSLADDMDGVRIGSFSHEADRAGAPILDRWTLAQRSVPCLVGISSGHPTLPGNRKVIATSDVWLLSEDRTCARTLSRWYQLGRPADHEADDA